MLYLYSVVTTFSVHAHTEDTYFNAHKHREVHRKSE